MMSSCHGYEAPYEGNSRFVLEFVFVFCLPLDLLVCIPIITKIIIVIIITVVMIIMMWCDGDCNVLVIVCG